MAGAALAADVSTPEKYVVEPAGEYEGKEPLAVVAALDLGIKARTPEQMALRGIQVHVFPQHSSFADIMSVNPDGVFFSNGPGDPASADHEVALARAVLDAGLPSSGFVLGTKSSGAPWGMERTSLPMVTAG